MNRAVFLSLESDVCRIFSRDPWFYIHVQPVSAPSNSLNLRQINSAHWLHRPAATFKTHVRPLIGLNLYSEVAARDQFPYLLAGATEFAYAAVAFATSVATKPAGGCQFGSFEIRKVVLLPAVRGFSLPS